ncbi:MAG TPA: type III-B CRISPR module RAMP protein Cmr6 [Bryobacteraceae bacterium]|nr:type III-B CRISPR module RAMP protein Cmr6 [Bryobacteraceae bacterium]
MPIPAVPKYLLNILGESNLSNLEQASPGLRFGLLLPIWTTQQDQGKELDERSQAKSRQAERFAAEVSKQGRAQVIQEMVARQKLPDLWQKNDFHMFWAWQRIITISPADKNRLKACIERQVAIANLLPSHSVLRVAATAVAPFTTGLGNEHPLENGFSFLSPYGLPYLPGSGVKGVLRQAARELASGRWGQTKGWSAELSYELRLRQDGQAASMRLSKLDVLFGRETAEGEKRHFRGVLRFWDVVPEIAGDGLLVEVMTPHYSDYYQNAASPHDCGQPNPICFLTVPPGSRFVFHVTCDLLRLRTVAPELLEAERWKQLTRAAFEHAFCWLGFGAKTAVGYGAMKEVEQAQPVKRVPSEGSLWRGATLRYDPGQKSIQAMFQNQTTAPLTGQAAEQFLAALGEERANQLRKSKTLTNVDVTVEVLGNYVKLTALA